MTTSYPCWRAAGLRPLVLLPLACALAHASPPEAGADAGILIVAAPPFAESADPVRSPDLDALADSVLSAPERPSLPGAGVSASSERLQLFGDLFTPAEISVLSAASNIAKATRAGLRANPGATTASGYAGAISTALVFDAGPDANAWPALTSWAANGSSLGTRLAHQALPLTLDFTQRHPWYDSDGRVSNTVSWIERSFVLLPTLHGSRSVEVGSDAFRLGLLEFVAGDRRRPAAGRADDFADFCSLWLKRVANVTVSELLNAGLTHQPTSRFGRVASLRERPQFPVTLSYSY